MNGPKRLRYCTANGLPFDTLIYTNRAYHIRQKQKKIHMENDWDVYIGSRVEVPGTNVHYIVPPNVSVNSGPISTIGATIPPGGTPGDFPQVPTLLNPVLSQYALPPPTSPESPPPYVPNDMPPPSYSECQNSQ